jgi:hypothetical protein
MKSYVVLQTPNSILFVKRDFRSSFDEKGGEYSIILPSMKYLQCDARNPNHIRIVLNESLSHILVMFSKNYFGLPCGLPRPNYFPTVVTTHFGIVDRCQQCSQQPSIMYGPNFWYCLNFSFLHEHTTSTVYTLSLTEHS